MKKFLTVLLVIAVMFTFSFGSAFAAQTVDYKYNEDAKVLYKAEAYQANEGAYGITEAYRSDLVSKLNDLLDGTSTVKAKFTKVDGDESSDVALAIKGENYYTTEKAAAKAAVEKAIENIKAAKTAKDAYKLYNDLVKKDGTLVKLTKTYVKDRFDFTTLAGDSSAIKDMVVYAGKTMASSAVSQAVLEYCGTFNSSFFNEKTDKFSGLKTDGGSDYRDDVLEWFFDNDYRTSTEIMNNVDKFTTALNPVNDAYTATIDKEWLALNARVSTIAKKYNAGSASYKNTVTMDDLETIDAILADIYDFADKYNGYVTKTNSYTLNGSFAFDYWPTALDDYSFVGALNAAKTAYLNQYYKELDAVTSYTRIEDAEKANVVALYDKVWALLDKYETVWDYFNVTAPTEDLVEGYSNLSNAYNKFAEADYTALSLITIAPLDATGKDFDDSEKNLANMADGRTAYDAFAGNYGYTAFHNDDLQTFESTLLAAEHNKATAAGYEEEANKIDTSKVQAYLNNATVKVTTKALGNTKIRVNATIDAMSFDYILKELEDGCTVSYQFYHKTAAAKTYKASSVKDRNYITYTSKSLKKGVKYKFQCSVIIKDAKGNVVATKDYKASTIGSRVCR